MAGIAFAAFAKEFGFGLYVIRGVFVDLEDENEGLFASKVVVNVGGLARIPHWKLLLL